MLYEWIVRLGSISDFSEMLPILMFILYRHTRKYPFLFIALCMASSINILSFFLSELNIYNLYLYHILGLVELILIYLFYTYHIAPGRFLKVAWGVCILLYISVSLYEGFDTINALSRSLSSLFLLTLGILYFYRIYQEEEVDIGNSRLFWINSALLFYFSTSFFTFLMSKKILSLEVTDLFSGGWLMHIVANIVKNVLIAISLRIREYG